MINKISSFDKVTQYNGLCDDCYESRGNQVLLREWSKLCPECDKCEECCRDTDDCDWIMKEDN